MLFNKFNVNGIIECELKTATRIITNKLSEHFDHKCTYSDLVQLGAGKPCTGALCMPSIHCPVAMNAACLVFIALMIYS